MEKIICALKILISTEKNINEVITAIGVKLQKQITNCFNNQSPILYKVYLESSPHFNRYEVILEFSGVDKQGTVVPSVDLMEVFLKRISSEINFQLKTIGIFGKYKEIEN